MNSQLAHQYAAIKDELESQEDLRAESGKRRWMSYEVRLPVVIAAFAAQFLLGAVIILVIAHRSHQFMIPIDSQLRDTLGNYCTSQRGKVMRRTVSNRFQIRRQQQLNTNSEHFTTIQHSLPQPASQQHVQTWHGRRCKHPPTAQSKPHIARVFKSIAYLRRYTRRMMPRNGCMVWRSSTSCIV